MKELPPNPLGKHEIVIVDDIFPSDDGYEVALSEMSAKYVQNLDCCQSDTDYPNDCQILTIETDNGGGGKFFRLRTGEAGWSFDEVEDFVTILNDFKQRIKCES